MINNIQLTLQHHDLAGNGMLKTEFLGAKLLGKQSRNIRKRLAFRAAILGIAQNGKTHVEAMQP